MLSEQFHGLTSLQPIPVRILDQAEPDNGCVEFGFSLEIILWHNYSSSIPLLDMILPASSFIDCTSILSGCIALQLLIFI